MSDLQTLVAQEAAKQLATFTADATVKKVLNYLKSSGGLPLGHLFAWPFQTPPDGAIQCNGAEYNRALYADFFAHASSKGWVKTESEWQQIASTNGGFCPWYSDGDGSTTFRTPKFAPFMQVAIASGNVGKYHQAGLPNITGSVSVSGGENDLSRTEGTFVSKGALTASSLGTHSHAGYSQWSGRLWNELSFSASDSDKTYGRSSTVQPESSEWMICVVVFGVATNVGSADVGNVMSAVAQVQAKLPNNLSNTTPLIVDTWKSGSDWYRVWSDGFIEQGGVKSELVSRDKTAVSFLKNFSNSSTVKISLTPKTFSNSYYNYSACVAAVDATVTGFKVLNVAEEIAHYWTATYWYACGY